MRLFALLLFSAPAIAGQLNPMVTQETIATTICAKGWAKSARPPAWLTNKLKKAQIAQYGLQNGQVYVEDHIIPIELGGNPTSPDNLQPQEKAESKRKDRLENSLKRKVCTGKMTLEEAQSAIANWN